MAAYGLQVASACAAVVVPVAVTPAVAVATAETIVVIVAVEVGPGASHEQKLEIWLLSRKAASHSAAVADGLPTGVMEVVSVDGVVTGGFANATPA